MATQEAKDAGFDEALMLDVDGFVAEGPGANIFIEDEGVLYTPQLGSILPGITRATVLDICNELEIEVVEKQLTLEDVHGRDGAFFCGTGAEIVGIESLDRIGLESPLKKRWAQLYKKPTRLW
jgi:branched-chain amino acid aminotransferase